MDEAGPSAGENVQPPAPDAAAQQKRKKVPGDERKAARFRKANVEEDSFVLGVQWRQSDEQPGLYEKMKYTETAKVRDWRKEESFEHDPSSVIRRNGAC